jgi:hypothetical protein
VLIPKADGALSAGEAGIAGPLLARVEEYAPERIALLRAVVARPGPDPATALAGLMGEDLATYDAFAETIAAACFMSPEVRRRVGFPGREPVPARMDVGDVEDLLLPILAAGFALR